MALRPFLTFCFSLLAATAYSSVSFTAQITESGVEVTRTVTVYGCDFPKGLSGTLEKLGNPIGTLVGSEPALRVGHGDGACYLYKKYRVSTIDDDNIACSLVEFNTDQEKTRAKQDGWHFFVNDPFSKGTTPARFNGIYKHYLFTDDSCCPGPSVVAVYDLDLGQKVANINGSTPSISKNDVLTYWAQERTGASHMDCPNPKDWHSGMGEMAIERRIEFDLENLSTSKTDETRCTQRQ